MPTSLLIHLYFPDENSEKASVIEKHGIWNLALSFGKFCFVSNQKKVKGVGVVGKV